MKKHNKIIYTFILLCLFFFTSCAQNTSVNSNNHTSSNSNNKNEEIKNTPIKKPNSSKGLTVHFIDVGQGDCELIQVNNKNLLIDAGPESAKDKVISYLKNVGVKKLDYVIATHPHEDHIGGMDDVIKNFEIDEFFAPKVTSNTKTFENMIKALNKKNLKIKVAKGGINFNLDSKVKCEILAPNNVKYDNLNNYSAVLRLTYENTRFLFTGDAEKESEQEMLKKDYNLSSEVLKIGHHGSRSSSSIAFLNKVTPKIGVISCEKNNSYGHPHKGTIKNLNKLNCKVYRTDLEGDIVLISDGDNINKLNLK